MSNQAPSVNLGFCNIYGAETGGATRVLGGLSESRPDRQWFCRNRSEGRYRMMCACGHRGQEMLLCTDHIKQYSGNVTFCPRCNNGSISHKCRVFIKEMS